MIQEIKKLPLISVIIPVYNVDSYLPVCLDSVIGQNYTNLEIIVVDDGSTDSSAAICDQYARKDNRIRVIHQPNGGVSAARNTGLDAATGEYIGFVDSDDWIDKDMFEVLYRSMIQYDVDISSCMIYYEKGGETKVGFATGEERLYTSAEALAILCEDKILQNYLSNKLYKSYLFDGIQFPVGKKYEDIYINYKLFYRASNIVLLFIPKYHYRTRVGSIVNSGFSNKDYYHYFNSMYEQGAFCLEKGFISKMPVRPLKKGLHIVCHMLLEPDSDEKNEYINDILQKLMVYRSLGIGDIGIRLAFRKYMLRERFEFYAFCYTTFRKIFKPTRYRLK